MPAPERFGHVQRAVRAMVSASWRESALLRERVRCISDHSGSSHSDPTYYYCPELRRVLVFLFLSVHPAADGLDGRPQWLRKFLSLIDYHYTFFPSFFCF